MCVCVSVFNGQWIEIREIKHVYSYGISLPINYTFEEMIRWDLMSLNIQWVRFQFRFMCDIQNPAFSIPPRSSIRNIIYG